MIKESVEQMVAKKQDGSPEHCKDCRNRVAKQCRIIGIYVPRKGGCMEFSRRSK